MSTLVDRVAHRVAAKIGVARLFLAEKVGDPKELVQDFERAIQTVIVPPDKIEWAKNRIQEELKLYPLPRSLRDWKEDYSLVSDISYKALFAFKHGQRRMSDSGHKLFLAILQTYTLPPALRKKVEIASRSYLKEAKPRSKEKGLAHNLEHIENYEKYLAQLQSHLAFAKEAVAKGKEHSEDGAGATKIKVGPFTLVNTGGFSEKQMAEVAEVVGKAASLAQSSGLGAVCYGEVQVTNTLMKGNVLAFYLVAKDELFIRANVKASTDVVRTVLHELGHRFEHKSLSESKRRVEHLYHLLSGQEIKRKWDPAKRLKHPEPGDTLEAKGKTYVVTRTVPAAGLKGYKVLLSVKDKPEASASVPLDTFWQLKGEKARNFDEEPEYVGFVSDYAKKGGPSENFAEMFSYYCLGRLPVLQSAPFESLVFGTEKSANERLAQRVARKAH